MDSQLEKANGRFVFIYGNCSKIIIICTKMKTIGNIYTGGMIGEDNL